MPTFIQVKYAKPEFPKSTRISIKSNYLILCFLTSFACLSQNDHAQDKLNNYLIGFQFKEADKYLEQNKALKSYKEYQCLNKILSHRGYERTSDSILLTNLRNNYEDISNKLIFYLAEAYYLLYNTQDNSFPIEYFDKAYIEAKKQKNQSLIKLSLIGFLKLYSQEAVQSSESYKSYLNSLHELSKETNDKAWFHYFNNYFTLSNLYTGLEEVSETSRILIDFSKKHKLSSSLKSYYYKDIGLYFKLQHQLDSAKHYFNKVIDLEDNYHISKNKFRSYIYLAEIESETGHFEKAKLHYELCKKHINKYNSLPFLYNLERNKAVHFYERTNNLDSAYWNLKHSVYMEAQLIIKKHALKTSELNVRLRTAEKEQEIKTHIATIKSEKEQKRNLWIASGVFLILSSGLAYLFYKNTKRKQLLAEQDKALETQKLTTVLKEQELISIDAMIEGQEKERQRIANDLHDDLGGLMATVKLHFNALKDKQTPKLYERTNQLIDEAYQKIRTIAHAKNSGVIAKQGLLKAIKDMAAKISATNKITIDVVDHGLENRLENSLELTIFRIIQELITNIIKHAKATEATIHITNHEDSLNIMVEDNGIGFNTSQVTKTNKGMGIRSIDKRVEHLNGTMTIESDLGKGSNVIIDLPI